jgi:hypothetical protein
MAAATKLTDQAGKDAEHQTQLDATDRQNI